jgi:hypothetical protein
MTSTAQEDGLATWTAEIERRGGETSIRNDKNSWRPLAVAEEQDGLALLHVTSWRYYGSATPRLARLSYLCGREDGQLWAVRVPGTVRTVPDALAWIEPAEVRKARLAGKRVLRQGDVYAVETDRAHDGAGADRLPGSHALRDGGRSLVHPQHGRTARRADGD